MVMNIPTIYKVMPLHVLIETQTIVEFKARIKYVFIQLFSFAEKRIS